jgi:hypothetical protein
VTPGSSTSGRYSLTHNGCMLLLLLLLPLA